MDMNHLPVRKVSIFCTAHPEWGTFGIMEDRGAYYELFGVGGWRVLYKSEAVKFWSVRRGANMELPQYTHRKKAYFSSECDTLYGSALYRSSSGGLVAVTEVVEIGNKPVSKWPDLVRVGFVYECVQGAPMYEWYG